MLSLLVRTSIDAWKDTLTFFASRAGLFTFCKSVDPKNSFQDMIRVSSRQVRFARVAGSCRDYTHLDFVSLVCSFPGFFFLHSHGFHVSEGDIEGAVHV